MAANALPITRNSIHVVIDMQELFASHPDWGIPTANSIVNSITALAMHRPERTLWTRFIPASNVASASGCWRPYYQRWPRATLEAGADIELISPLKAMARPEMIFDKAGYSAFKNAGFETRLRAMEADTLILSGAETDICVLSTALSAIDRGFFVVLATDAITSIDLKAHRDTLEVLMPRFAPQIRLAASEKIISAWR